MTGNGKASIHWVSISKHSGALISSKLIAEKMGASLE